jgi:hypothetical protein
MRMTKQDLAAAVEIKIISSEQAQKLADFLLKRQDDTPSFRLTHLLYYFGGLLAISAITLFVTQAWELMRGLPLFILSSLLFIFGLLITRYFLDKKLTIPAGIMATFSLAVVPLAIYNLQSWLGYFPKTSFEYVDYHSHVDWSWAPMEFGTLFVGVFMLYYYRFPFLLFPVAVTLWYMSMDLYPLLVRPVEYTFQQRSLFSMYFGLMMLVVAVYMDFKHSDDKKDYAFWLYLFGLLSFWGGLSLLNSSSELSHFIYCMINVLLILISVFLNRRVFAVFGAAGVIGYLGHLSFNVFANSLSFPVALIFLGVLLILAASRWARVEDAIYRKLQPYIPNAILKRHE